MSDKVRIKKVLDAFFKNDSSASLVLKGSWGIGKTYFWEKHVEDNKDTGFEQLAYSYVSLFGLNNLSEVKAKIFHSGVPLKKKEVVEAAFEKCVEENNALYKYIPTAKIIHDWASGGKVFRFLSQFSQEMPGANKVASLISAAEYGLVKNYIICFDDIERKGRQLSVNELMGLVNELCVKKKCKVVLIFNDKTLEKTDQEEFAKYREKVIDIEIEFKPTVEENLRLIFNGSEPYYPQLLKTFQALKLPNIRIFKKAKWALEVINPFIADINNQLKDEIVAHIAVFCWGYYNREAQGALSLQAIKSKLIDSDLLSFMSSEKKEPSEEDKRWKEIASELGLSYLKCDKHLMSLIEDGFLNEESFKGEITALHQEAHKFAVWSQIKAAWNIYRDSFKDNIAEFMQVLKRILDEDMDDVTLTDFSSIISVLKDFGEDVDGYVDKYITKNVTLFEQIDIRSEHLMGKITNDKLLKAIESASKKTKLNLNLDNVIAKLAQHQWNEDDLEYMGNVTPDDLYEWMLSAPSDMNEKIKNGLLFLRRVQTDDLVLRERFKVMGDKTVAALQKIATTNPLNSKRVKKIYGIDAEQSIPGA